MIEQKTNNSIPFLCSWSGGKDSYLACYRAKVAGYVPSVLLNNLNEGGEISRSHGIPKFLLEEQAKSLGLPIEFNATTWEDYEKKFIDRLKYIKSKFPIEAAVYGDIDIESHRAWEEQVSAAAGLKPLLPIWQGSRLGLVNEMLDIGMKCMIVSCRAELAEDILGKVIDQELLKKFDELEIDACGENGEYHTFVIDGPLHTKITDYSFSGTRVHGHYAFLNFSEE